MSKGEVSLWIARCDPPKANKGFKDYKAVCKKTVFLLEDAKKYELTSSLTSDDSDEVVDSDESEAMINSNPDDEDTGINLNKRQLEDADDKDHSKRIKLSFEAQVLRQLTALSDEMKSIRNQIDANTASILQLSRQLSSTDRSMVVSEAYGNHEVVDNPFSLPIDSEESLRGLEEALNSGEQNCSKLMTILTIVGGNSMKVTLKNMLKRIFTREMAMTYSLKGKKGKKAFEKLKVCEVVVGGIQVLYKDVTNFDIGKEITCILSGEGDWDGGRAARNKKN